MKWASAVKSTKGIREENQDNYLLLSPNGNARYLENQMEQVTTVVSWHQQFLRLAIADGVGGHRQGREMAENIIQHLLLLPPQHSPAEFRDHLYQLHNELLTRFYQPGQQNPGSTLILADVSTNGIATIAHIGDSRAMLWRNNAWRILTHDHTQAEFDWRDGTIDQEIEPQHSTTRPMLAQAVGYGSYGLIADEYGYRPLQLNKQIRIDLVEELPNKAAHHADIFTLQLTPGDNLLLATDGLLGLASITACPDFAKLEPQYGYIYLENLIQEALEQGSEDNVTAVLLQCMSHQNTDSN